MKYNKHIHYIDTDGIKVSCKLDSDVVYYYNTNGNKVTFELEPSVVGKGLGKMKYEGTYKEAVFIAPKVYGGILKSDNTQDVKVKGLKEYISY
jgi:hypothetical protein